ncbi:MAG: hypothetical protein ACRD2O_09245, partial [Terriglobia bacterium]
PEHCENPLCPGRSRSWFGRRRQPRGLWLNEQWYCGTACLRQGAERFLRRFDLTSARHRPLRYRQPIGLLMHSRGLITDEKLKAAIQAQKEAGSGRLGEWLIRLGATTEEQVTATLSLQWGCPIFPIEQKPHFLEWSFMVPFPILKAARMIVAHGQPANNTYYLAFADGIDHTVIRSFEAMYECDGKPCVAQESAFNGALGQLEATGLPPTTIANCEYHPLPVSEIIQQAADALDAETLRLVSCAGFHWLRLQHAEAVQHLLIPVPVPENEMEEHEVNEALIG